MSKSKNKGTPPPSPIQSYVRTQQGRVQSLSTHTKMRPSVSPTTAALHRLRKTLSSPSPVKTRKSNSGKDKSSKIKLHPQDTQSRKHKENDSPTLHHSRLHSKPRKNPAPSPTSSSLSSVSSSLQSSPEQTRPKKKPTSDSTPSQGKKQRNGQAPFAAPSAIHSDTQDPFRHPDKYAWSRKLDGHRGLYRLDQERGLVSRQNRSLQHLIPPNTIIPPLLKKHFKVVEGEVIALINHEYLQKAADMPHVKSAYRELCSAAARKDWSPPQHIEIVFYLFDGEPRQDREMPFLERYNLLKECVQSSSNPNPKTGFFRVITQHVGFYSSRDLAAKDIFNRLKDSDEGIVIRHIDATYAKPKMFKMKIPNGEWLVVGHLLRSVDANTNKYETDIRHHKYVKVPEYLMEELLTIQRETPNVPIDVIVNTRRNFVASFHTKWC